MLQATVAGNIGKDAETREVGKDTVTSFSVASSKKIKEREVTVWVRCNMWGKRGEALAQYLTTGAAVAVTGELSTREYEKDGQTKTSLELRVNDLALMGGKSNGDGARPPSKGQQQETFDSETEDLPF